MFEHLFSRGSLLTAACLIAFGLCNFIDVESAQAECRSPYCSCQLGSRGYARYSNVQRSHSRSFGTSVFVNGRELSYSEVASLERNFGSVIRGSYWLDRYGNYGFVGGPRMGNLYGTRSGGSRRKSLLSGYFLTGVKVF